VEGKLRFDIVPIVRVGRHASFSPSRVGNKVELWADRVAKREDPGGSDLGGHPGAI
jgi:hypothetical protein